MYNVKEEKKNRCWSQSQQHPSLPHARTHARTHTFRTQYLPLEVFRPASFSPEAPAKGEFHHDTFGRPCPRSDIEFGKVFSRLHIAHHELFFLSFFLSYFFSYIFFFFLNFLSPSVLFSTSWSWYILQC